MADRPALGKHSEKTIDHARLVPGDLSAGDRHDRHTARLEAHPFQPVALERDPIRMGIPTVELDAEAGVAPKEVDL